MKPSGSFGVSMDLFSAQKGKPAGFAKRKQGLLVEVLADVEERVVHSTSRATHDFIAKAAAFELFTRQDQKRTANPTLHLYLDLSVSDAAVEAMHERGYDQDKEVVELLDTIRNVREDQDDEAEHFQGMELRECTCEVSALKCFKESLGTFENLAKQQPCMSSTDFMYSPDRGRRGEGNFSDPVLIDPCQKLSPALGRQCEDCSEVTAPPASARAAGTSWVSEKHHMLSTSPLSSEANKLRSQEPEAPSTPDLQPEVNSLDRMSAIHYCSDAFLSSEEIGSFTALSSDHTSLHQDDSAAEFLLEKETHSEKLYFFDPVLERFADTLCLDITSAEQGEAPHVCRQHDGSCFCGVEVPGVINAGSRGTSSLKTDSELMSSNKRQEDFLNTGKMAVRIQSAYRGYMARKAFLQMHSAAKAIQACYRRWMVQKWYCSLKVTVVKIQASVRGKQIHMQYRHLERATLVETALREWASTVIQAHVRGHKVRLMLGQWQAAAAEIQRWWRAYQQKQKYKVEKGKRHRAAQLLQSCWRDFCARRRQHRAYIEKSVQQNAALLLQAFARGYLARKQFSTLRRNAVLLCQPCKECPQEEVMSVFSSYLDISNSGVYPVVPSREESNIGHPEEGVEKSVLAVTGGNENDKGYCDSPSLSSLKIAKLHESDSTATLPGRNCNNSSLSSAQNSPASFGKLCSAESVKQVDSCMYPAADHFLTTQECLGPASTSLPEAERIKSEVKLDDWSNVQVDHLDECLDTCLAYLRPLPSFLPCDIAGEPRFLHLDVLDTNRECSKLQCVQDFQNDVVQNSVEDCLKFSQASVANGRFETGNMSLETRSTAAMHGQVAGRYNYCEQEKEASVIQLACLKSENQVTSRRVVSINQRQNKEKLEHFAEVFLLQRYIAQQQRRAQCAPPFPPEVLPAEPSALEDVDSPLNKCVQENPYECRSEKLNLNAVGHENRDSCVNSSTSVDNLWTEVPSKLVKESGGWIAGADVVLDIVELLKQLDKSCNLAEPQDTVININEVCSNTLPPDAYATAASKSCCRSPTPTLSQQLVVPNVKAVFVVVVAVVVYTRMLCHGALVWARGSQRKH